jgi:hypothetical protein
MKQKRSLLFTLALPAILLVCFLLPSSAFAASGTSNDNHTDTADYCLRAHDVTIGLSEFQSKSRAELESDIVSASAFAFLIRDTANETGQFVPITSGFSVDFSNLTEAASSSGYTVTVTLPAITLSEPSRIHFRVFVTDDLPQPRTVRYEFVSGTADHVLPADVTAQLPAVESMLSGTTVTPAGAFSPARDGVGQWTFSGWSPGGVTLSDSDVTFTGTWVWTALPVCHVSYTFVSGSPGRALPDGVLAKLPAPTIALQGDTVTAPAALRAFHMTQGTWRFSGWDSGSRTVDGGDVLFTGVWRWHEKSDPAPTANATATPNVTPTPTDTPAAAALVTDPPNPPPAAPEEQVSAAQTPAANTAEGGSAKMVVATVLTALIATQVFAVASDLKVLKWYNAKKAARRARV